MPGMVRRQLFGLAAGLVALALPAARAAEDADRLAEVLRLDEVIAVMREEGLSYGDVLDDEMLGGRGGAYWRQRVGEIYATAQMAGFVRAALAAELNPEQAAATIAFFETERGQLILALETSARSAMADPEVEEIARATYRALEGSDDDRLAQVTRFVEINDLLERNVAGALNSSYHFYRGLVDGGGADLDEAGILAEVWGQEAEMRADTEEWLYGFLLMAYRPLSDADLAAYSDFSETPAGRALNAALFDGFDAMFRAISYALGLSVAQAMAASDL